MREVYEIEEAVNGVRLDMWGADRPWYKENLNTRLEALTILIRHLQKEVVKEEHKLKKASGMI